MGKRPNWSWEQESRLGALYSSMKRDGNGAVVLHDHIGIAQALNDFRNGPIEGLQQYLATVDPANGYHHARIGVLLGCIETVGLAEKLRHNVANPLDWDPRTALELGAGVLSVGAGACSARLDWLKVKEEKDPGLRSIYFLCMIGDQVACGQFAGGESLPEGETVKAVVSRKGDVLYVDAVVDEKNGLVWIQHPWGTTAEVWVNIKIGVGVYLVALVFAGLVLLLSSTKDEVGSSAQLFIWGAIASAAMMLVMTIWNACSRGDTGIYTTRAYRLFGFENPEKVNLNGYTCHGVLYGECLKRREPFPAKYDVLRECQYKDVYSLRKAIEDGKVRLKSTQRPA